mgnify:CR=1 FL=1
MELIRSGGEALAEKLIRGMLHTSNRNSRTLWELIRGETLPKGNRGTNEYIETLDEVRALRSIRRAEEEEATLKRQQEEEAAKQQTIERVTTGIREHGEIDVDDLLIVAKELSIKVHPRTIGMIRKRVNWIKMEASGLGRCEWKGRGYPPESVYGLLNDVKKALTR